MTGEAGSWPQARLRCTPFHAAFEVGSPTAHLFGSRATTCSAIPLVMRIRLSGVPRKSRSDFLGCPLPGLITHAEPQKKGAQRLSSENPGNNRPMDTRWKPSVTVAAVIERDGRFMLVEEETPEGLRLNNPAGHLDP